MGGGEAGNAATNFGDQEGQVGMAFGKLDEFVHVGFYGLGTPVHGWDGVRLPLQADAPAPYGSEFIYSQQGGTTPVGSGEVAAKDENLVRPELLYARGRCAGGCVKVVHIKDSLTYQIKGINLYLTSLQYSEYPANSFCRVVSS